MNRNIILIVLTFALSLISIRLLTITELSLTNFFLTQNFLIPIIIGLCIDFYCLQSKKAPKWLLFFLTFLSVRSLFHTSNNDIVILFSSLMILSTVLSWKGINTFATFLVSFWLTYNYETSFIGILDVLSHNILSYLVLMSFILMCLLEKRNYLIKDKQTIVFAILASCYFSSFIAKFIMPDNSFVNYLKLNDMSNLITAAVINRSSILPISFLTFLEPFIWFLKFISLTIEVSWILVFWFSMNQKRILIAITIGMHIMIYLTTGILFSQWIVLLILMLIYLEKTKPIIKLNYCLVGFILLTSLFKLGPGPYLGWLDSKCVITYDFISKNGVVNRNTFSPFNLPLTQNRLQKFINNDKVNVRSTFGSASNKNELLRFNSTCNRNLYLEYENYSFKKAYQDVFFKNINTIKKKSIVPYHITDIHENYEIQFPLVLIKEKYFITDYLQYKKITTDTLKTLTYE